jgi:hypothetical protein
MLMGGVSAYDRNQTISNEMLVNYRYGRIDDFDGNVLTIITSAKDSQRNFINSSNYSSYCTQQYH